MNDNSRKRYQFPATLSNQERWFGLTIDEAIILIPQGFLMVFYSPYVFAITLLVSFFTIRHLKKGKGSSYLLCVMLLVFTARGYGFVYHCITSITFKILGIVMNFNRIKEVNRSLGIAVLIMTVIAASTSLLAHRLYSTNKELVQNAIENRQIIVTPMINNTNQEYGFKGERGGSDYLRLMGLSFISLRLDVNSQTVENSHDILLSYASNELREKLIPILSQEKRSFKR